MANTLYLFDILAAFRGFEQVKFTARAASGRIRTLPPERGCVPQERDQPQQSRKTGRLEYAGGRRPVLRLIPRCAGHSRAPIQ
jgi:hypothetical protein